ncbi:protein prune homolog 2 [Diabrotica virgifera virgifera]|uniref:CRAL-TRIO domain-containing protein n=1 Tax=Diabrotica virgifera virgifera TaxID=50390 RepID=A0ABM5ITF8_DIAVI|nr:protein prune homolog 2 [Diabrotica virgifera virgifera]
MDVMESPKKSFGNNVQNNTSKTTHFQVPSSVLIDEINDVGSDCVDKNVTLKNATNFHPLMSPISQDFPDLIPKQAKVNIYEEHFHPEAHSSVNELYEPGERQNEDLSTDLPEFPSSPSLLRKSILGDVSVEMTPNDVISDTEYENDKSVYEAHLSSNLQNVSLKLNEKEGNLNFLAHNKRSNKLRKIKVVQTQLSDDSDVSSADTNTDSLKSEDVFNGEVEEFARKLDDENTTPEPIEPLSAADERCHARYWQRMVLPGGEQRTIDMRVIEPYKRVLSHGGYLRAGGNTAIVVFSACYLPDKSRIDYVYVMDNLFLYVLWTLERLVTEDYVLIYLHGAANKLPSFGWLKRCYQMVGRKLRKNLSHLYMVHPTLWIKTMLFMAKPFISSKFYRKISFISTLRELMVRVPLEAAAIPDKVKLFDSLHFAT